MSTVYLAPGVPWVALVAGMGCLWAIWGTVKPGHEPSIQATLDAHARAGKTIAVGRAEALPGVGLVRAPQSGQPAVASYTAVWQTQYPNARQRHGVQVPMIRFGQPARFGLRVDGRLIEIAGHVGNLGVPMRHAEAGELPAWTAGMPLLGAIAHGRQGGRFLVSEEVVAPGDTLTVVGMVIEAGGRARIDRAVGGTLIMGGTPAEIEAREAGSEAYVGPRRLKAATPYAIGAVATLGFAAWGFWIRRRRIA